MAEAWLLKAETDLMHCECEAAKAGARSSGTRPHGRHEPWDLSPAEHPGENLPDDYDEHEGWEPSVPGHALQGGFTKTYLADYWWGQPQEVANTMVQFLNQAMRHLSRYGSLADADTRERLWPRSYDVETNVSRRGAAAVASMDAAVADGPFREMMGLLRQLFAGTSFEPTDEFVRRLKQAPGSVWAVSCAHGLGGVPSRTMISVMDTTPDSRYDEHILEMRQIEGASANARREVSAGEAYDALRTALAGAGGESRSISGPPRRPEQVRISWRLRAAAPALTVLRAAVGVRGELESEAGHRFACANNGTDFDTAFASGRRPAPWIPGRSRARTSPSPGWRPAPTKPPTPC
jgi:hypothetical protein